MAATSKLRHSNVMNVGEHTKLVEAERHNTDDANDIQNLLDSRLHRDVFVDCPHDHTNTNQNQE